MFKSCFRALLPEYISTIFWMIIFVAIILVLQSWQDGKYKEVLPSECANQTTSETQTDYENRIEKECTFDEYTSSLRPGWPEISMFLSYIVILILFVILLIILWNLLLVLPYEAFSTYDFIMDEEDDKKLTRTKATNYSFINTKHADLDVVDRVLEVELIQSWLDKILNTGSVKLHFVKFKNADSESETHTLPCYYLDNPEALFNALKAVRMDHEGFLIRDAKDTTEES